MIAPQEPRLPEGFTVARGMFADVHLTEVVDAIAWRQQSIKMFGREILQPRMTAWMGSAAYTYSRIRHEPAPMPAVVGDILERVENHLGTFFNSVLGNLYRHGGDSVAWHSDDEPELGPTPTIASVSLGAERVFQIRRVGAAYAERVDVVLRHGDLLVMRGRSQSDYEHAVPKVRETVGPRVNLTFRQVYVYAVRE